ncbi:hypothetical protein FQZ97_703010 [compost metagenome]
MLDAGAATVALRLAVDNCLHPLQHLFAHLGVQGTQAQAQQRALGNHVGCFAGLQGADGDHRRLLRIDVAPHHRLQGHHGAGRGHQRVDGEVRHGAVAADAFDHHVQQVLGGHQRTRAEAQVAGFQAGHVVHAVQGFAGESLQQAIGEHGLGAALAFLGGLEDQVERALEVARGRQVARRAQQHGGMAVVAAGVHASGVATAVGQAGVFEYGQGIHVGAQAQGAAGAAIAQHADHAGVADAGVHLIAPFTQQARHQGGGALFFETQFGVGVDVLAQCLELDGDVVEPGLDMCVTSHCCCSPRGSAAALRGWPSANRAGERRTIEGGSAGWNRGGREAPTRALEAEGWTKKPDPARVRTCPVQPSAFSP